MRLGFNDCCYVTDDFGNVVSNPAAQWFAAVYFWTGALLEPARPN